MDGAQLKKPTVSLICWNGFTGSWRLTPFCTSAGIGLRLGRQSSAMIDTLTASARDLVPVSILANFISSFFIFKHILLERTLNYTFIFVSFTLLLAQHSIAIVYTISFLSRSG